MVTNKAVTDAKPSFRARMRVLAILLRRYPRRSVFVLIMAFIGSLAESIGILAILPLFESLSGGSVSEESIVSKVFVKGFGVFGIEPTVPAMLTVMFLLILLKAGVAFWALRYVGVVMAQMIREMRLNLLNATLSARWDFFVSRKIGRFVNAVGSEVPIATAAYQAAVEFVGTALEVAIFLAAAFLVSPMLALASVVSGALMVLSLGYFVKLARSAGYKKITHLQSLVARLTDCLQGIKAVKAMNTERWIVPFLEKQTDELNEAAKMQVVAKSGIRIFREPIIVGVIALGIYCAFEVLGIQLAGLVTMVAIFYRTANSIGTIQQKYQQLGSCEFFYWSVTDLTNDAAKACEQLTGGGKAVQFDQSLTFSDVSFAYDEKKVIDSLDLTCSVGSFTALIGASGAGKTTILDMTCGLLQPTGGRIAIDGVSLAEADLVQWRRQIGYVPQDLFLFHDTLYKNITLGDPTISRELVEQTLAEVDAMGFVSAMPEGIDTVLGERGVRISGGQRQRVSIARAMVRQPRLLILDEATTALDPKTENEIMATLKKLRGSVTILAVSHQPAIVDAADKVVYLENGRITRGAGEKHGAPTGRPAPADLI